MEKTKPVQVVMLPTEDKTILKKFYMVDTYQLLFNQNHIIAPYQHLYFISTDLIKKHDCYLESRYEREPFIDKADDSWEDDKTDPLFGKNPEGTFKVIASTDPSLGLPAIPLTWIRDVYVPSNGSIKEVRLETEPYLIRNGDNTLYYDIKLTQDNEVVIVDKPAWTSEPISTVAIFTLKDGSKKILEVPINQELEDVAEKAYPINNSIRDTAKQVMLKKAFKQGWEECMKFYGISKVPDQYDDERYVDENPR